MSRVHAKDGYVIGNRPPKDLSPEAKEQLDKGRVSPVLAGMVCRAKKANVSILGNSTDKDTQDRLVRARNAFAGVRKSSKRK